LIGDKPFSDSTNLMIGLLPRDFKSFKDASNEAGFSRMYGGIHFRCDNEDGLEMGTKIGNYILSTIKTHPARQNATGTETKTTASN
ncbi:MAG TPA: hypothetical protein PL045_13385, partial [Chitinophagaceae bacterium]|nr:hypothetical protein [Chitinophagaceae bacterium]